MQLILFIVVLFGFIVLSTPIGERSALAPKSIDRQVPCWMACCRVCTGGEEDEEGERVPGLIDLVVGGFEVADEVVKAQADGRVDPSEARAIGSAVEDVVEDIQAMTEHYRNLRNGQ